MKKNWFWVFLLFLIISPILAHAQSRHSHPPTKQTHRVNKTQTKPSLKKALKNISVEEALKSPFPSSQMNNGGPYRLSRTARVFLILGGYKFEIPDVPTFIGLYGLIDATAVTQTPGLENIPNGGILPEGTELVSSHKNPQLMYLVVKGVRHVIGSWPTFAAYNLNERFVTKLSTATINSFKIGAPITIPPPKMQNAVIIRPFPPYLKVAASPLAREVVIASPISSNPDARGYSAVAMSHDPESRICGSASLDRETSIVSISVLLETDSTTAGPKGHMVVVLRDEQGKDFVTIDVGDVGTGGKPPGKAARRYVHAQATLDKDVAAKVTSVGVTVTHTGSETGLFNINSHDVITAIRIARAILGQ